MESLIDTLPAVDLPTRLEIGAPAFGEGPYAELRVNGAAWIRDGGSEAFGAALETIEPLLSRSYLLGQPNLAGMGVGAWDLAVPTAAEALLAGQSARLQRMISGTQLADLFDEDDGQDDDDTEALTRGADLLAAMQTLQAAAADLSEDAPPELHAQLTRLHGDLRDRLRREQQHHPGLRRALRDQDLDDVATVLALRARSGRSTPAANAPAQVVKAPRSADPYGDAIDGVLALEPQIPSPALAELRARIAQAADKALAAPTGSSAAIRLTERARRLLAEEVKLSGGRPVPGGAVDTQAIRKQLAPLPARDQRPQGPIRPRADLPEVPILSSRGPKAKVIGYLRVDEGTQALQRSADHVQVPVPGRTQPGWIATAHLADPTPSARGPQFQPNMPSAQQTERPGKRPVGPDLARFAAMVSRETGASLTDLIAQVGEPVLARARKDRGAAMAEKPKRYAVDRVQIDGLKGDDQATRAVQTALSRLPALLERRAQDAHPTGKVGEVNVHLDVRVDGDLRAEADLLADRIAQAIASSGGAQIEALHLDVTPRGGAHAADTTDVLLSRLANDDFDGIAETLVAERRPLDATQQARLARFFGDDFSDVLVFAGPMAGALARSLDAEAVTHGQMVFFDPVHYRPDTAKGEALLAHELTHTRQDDDRGVAAKEAEALAIESAYLSWIEPAGMSFATEIALDPTAPSAAAAADVAAGMRAQAGREVAQKSGPRKDTAEFEQKVGQILERVRHLLDHGTDFEGQRVGALVRRLLTW